MNKIECVIVSVNYSDILAYTLPQNKTYFSKVVVVTDLGDEKTKRICEIYGIQCIQTNVFYKNSTFDKGAGITEGLKYLSKDGWVVQLDADIWLHPQAIRELYKLKLNKNCLYGCDRVMIESFRKWIKFISYPDLYLEDWLMNLSDFKVGSRITQYWNGHNWQVLGFFQMWNPSQTKIYTYPSNDDASKSDIVFSSLWKREDRILLPEIIAFHLENGKSQTGSNWSGRTTKAFKIK